MKLQKHERQLIKSIRKMAKRSKVEMEVLGHDGQTHLRIKLKGPHGTGTVAVASSPKNVDHAVKNTTTDAERLIILITGKRK